MSNPRQAERRQFGRRQSCIHAYALIAGRAPAYCIVRNFSEKGALLEFNEPLVPPFTLRLVIESKNVDVACEVRHQGHYGVGVRFVEGSVAGLLEQPARNAKAPDAGQRLQIGQPVPRTSGCDLRSTMFGVQQRQVVAEPVRGITQETSSIFRGS